MDCPWNSPGQNTGVGSLSLLQGIFLTQGSNPGLSLKTHVLEPIVSLKLSVMNYFMLVIQKSL